VTEWAQIVVALCLTAVLLVGALVYGFVATTELFVVGGYVECAIAGSHGPRWCKP
jgi:hypothetical protein